jgi:hypothetical protein
VMIENSDSDEIENSDGDDKSNKTSDSDVDKSIEDDDDSISAQLMDKFLKCKHTSMNFLKLLLYLLSN